MLFNEMGPKKAGNRSPKASGGGLAGRPQSGLSEVIVFGAGDAAMTGALALATTNDNKVR